MGFFAAVESLATSFVFPLPVCVKPTPENSRAAVDRRNILFFIPTIYSNIPVSPSRRDGKAGQAHLAKTVTPP